VTRLASITVREVLTVRVGLDGRREVIKLWGGVRYLAVEE